MPTTSKSPNGNDALIVFVDRLTKRMYIAATKKTVTSNSVTKLFFDTVFKYHGWPKEVVSDRDTRLTASFWADLQAFTCTKLNMSTSNNPQTDG